MKFDFLKSKTLRDVSLGAVILGGIYVFASSAFGFEEEIKKQGCAFAKMALRDSQEVKQVTYNSLEEFKGLRFLRASSAGKVPGTDNVFLIKGPEFLVDSLQDGYVYLRLWGLHEMVKSTPSLSASRSSDARDSGQGYRMLVTTQNDGLKSIKHLPGYFFVTGEYCAEDLRDLFQVGTMLPLMQGQEDLFSKAREYYIQQNVPEAFITQLNCLAFVLSKDEATQRALGELVRIGEIPYLQDGENVSAVKFLHKHLNTDGYGENKDLKPTFFHPHAYGYENHFTPEGRIKISSDLIRIVRDLEAELKRPTNTHCTLRKKEAIKFLLLANMNLSDAYINVVSGLLGEKDEERIPFSRINPYIIEQASRQSSHYLSWLYFTLRADNFLEAGEISMLQTMGQEDKSVQGVLKVPTVLTKKIEDIVDVIDALALRNGGMSKKHSGLHSHDDRLYSHAGNTLRNVTPSHVATYMSQEEPDLELKRSAVVHLASFNNLKEGNRAVRGCARTSDPSHYTYPEINPSDIDLVVRILKSRWGGPNIFSTPGFLERSVLKNLDSIQKVGQKLLEEEPKAEQKAL